MDNGMQVVAYLDTGTGKTLISVLLIKEKMDELLDNTGEHKKFTLFLAPKVDLVIQQAEVIRFHTTFSVGHYVGAMGVDFWDLSQWRKQFSQHEVLVMTYQILLNILHAGFIMLNQIHLLIFDECHHVKKSHAGNTIMQEFYHNKSVKGPRPRIFGMTASPLDQKGQNEERTRQFFDELEHNLNAKVMTIADRSEMDLIVPRPAESTIEFPGSITNAATRAALEKLELISTRLAGTSRLIQAEMQDMDVRRAGLQDAGVAFDQERRSTESGVMARSLQGVGHILETLGPFCATVCLREILSVPTKSKQIDDKSASAEAHPKLGMYLDSDSDEDEIDLREDTWWLGAVKSSPTRDCNANETVALNEAFLDAAQLFSDLLLQHLPKKPQIADSMEVKDPKWPDLRRKLVAALQIALGTITAERLDLEIDAVLASLGRDRFRSHARVMAPLVSPKAAVLVRHLQEYREIAEEPVKGPGALRWSGIVFAKRKLTAVALEKLLAKLPRLSFLKAQAIMGHGGHLAATSLSAKKQQEVLEKLKKGQINMLMSTAVTEEGLDLTQCRLVVRFDLPDRPVDYIQSRGRARAADSKMVLMIESGNAAERDLIEDVRRLHHPDGKHCSCEHH